MSSKQFNTMRSTARWVHSQGVKPQPLAIYLSVYMVTRHGVENLKCFTWYAVYRMQEGSYSTYRPKS